MNWKKIFWNTIGAFIGSLISLFWLSLISVIATFIAISFTFLLIELVTFLQTKWSKVKTSYHWYEVKYVYKNNGHIIFDWITQIGIKNKKDLLDRRKLNKIIKPLHKNGKPHVKKYLCNG